MKYNTTDGEETVLAPIVLTGKERDVLVSVLGSLRIMELNDINVVHDIYNRLSKTELDDPTGRLVYTQADIDEARQSGYEDGYKDGYN